MPWKKKFPGIGDALAGQAQASPIEPMTPAPSALPALPQPSLPGAPKQSLQPNLQEEVKRRALKNIAMGVKGF